MLEKLVNFIREHDVIILAVASDAITVESQVLDTRNGEIWWERTRIPATVESVREFLGY